MGVTSIVHDMPHFVTADEKCIRKKLSMATPWHRFCAHERAAPAVYDRFEFFHDLLEFDRQHKIRVGAKGRDSPGRVR